MKKIMFAVLALTAIGTSAVALAEAPKQTAPISCPAGYTPVNFFGHWQCWFGVPADGSESSGGGMG